MEIASNYSVITAIDGISYCMQSLLNQEVTGVSYMWAAPASCSKHMKSLSVIITFHLSNTMAAFIHRRRQEKQERPEHSDQGSQDPVEAAHQSSNVLRRIKSSPLIRFVSSTKKRERDVE